MAFDHRSFLPANVLDRITDIRVTDPERSLRAAKERKRRTSLTRKGKLNIIAADHPARRVTRVGNDPLKMTDRREYMSRILRVLMSDSVDGILATMDIIEDLLILHDLMREQGAQSFLDDKLLIPSFNRAALLGSSWEIDDPLSGATAATCAEWGLDGAKLLLRICDAEPDSLKTILAAVQSITELNKVGLPMFLESLPVEKIEGGYRIIKQAEDLARTVGAAAAMGDSARYLWLKLPYCENFEMVARATTLPILLLAGDPVGDVTPFLRELAAGMRSGANVRGALAGRNILYPGDDDPLGAIEAVGKLVHEGATFEQSIEAQAEHRGRDMNWLSPIL